MTTYMVSAFRVRSGFWMLGYGTIVRHAAKKSGHLEQPFPA